MIRVEVTEGDRVLRRMEVTDKKTAISTARYLATKKYKGCIVEVIEEPGGRIHWTNEDE